LTGKDFLEAYLWCIAGIRIPATSLAKKWDRILSLFRKCEPKIVAREGGKIKDKWRQEKLGLNEGKVDAFLQTATDVAEDWDVFRDKYVPEPPKPDSEQTEDWQSVFSALDQLPFVGAAVGWFLVRNVYGGAFFKPDTHLVCIAQHYFNGDLEAMAMELRRLWPAVCSDRRFHPVHIGEVDYFVWNYRRMTGKPECS
jgi:hypothetical protein